MMGRFKFVRIPLARTNPEISVTSRVNALKYPVSSPSTPKVIHNPTQAIQTESNKALFAVDKKAKVPESAGASAIMIFGAIASVTKETIGAWMEYLERFDAEWQACFAINIAKNPTKQSVAFSSAKFADWVQRNEDLL